MKTGKLKLGLIALCLVLLFTAGCAAPASAAPSPAASPAQAAQTSAASPEEGGSFWVHFIDVGQADAALVECDGHFMLIDGGNRGDSDVIYTVLNIAG